MEQADLRQRLSKSKSPCRAYIIFKSKNGKCRNYIGIVNQPLPTKNHNQFNVKLKCIQPYPRYNEVLKTQHMKVQKKKNFQINLDCHFIL